MTHRSGQTATDSEGDLKAGKRNRPLRFMICGSPGDGKTTLIERLHEGSGTIVEDRACSFSTDRRDFIAAPGYGELPGSLVTTPSNVDLVVILVDANTGMPAEARRHSYIASLLGISKVLLAVNKMDQVEFERKTFSAIVSDYRDFASRIGLADFAAIPISALRGDNVTEVSPCTPWYQGPALLPYLESVETGRELLNLPFRMPVQAVDRPDASVHGLTGTIVSGTVNKGDRVRIAPSGKESRVSRIVTKDGDVDVGIAGQPVTLACEDEVDGAEGDLLASAESPASIADQFLATIVWMHDEPMLPGRPYVLKIGARSVASSVTLLKYKINLNTLEHLAARQLELHEIGICNVGVDHPIPFDPYSENRETGRFVLIDRFTNAAVGAGIIQYALRRADNIHWQALDVNKAARAHIKGQKPCALWFTGLSGAGKSTIANLLEKRLLANGKHTYLLDGDNIRHGLNRDLGFTDADRVENIRRVAEVMRLMVDAGLIVMVSFISPFRSERRMARSLLAEGEFIEVFVDTPLAEAERRDTKGLYSKARRGELKHFTGIDSPYEEPENPEIRINTLACAPDSAVELIIERLAGTGMLGQEF